MIIMKCERLLYKRQSGLFRQTVQHKTRKFLQAGKWQKCVQMKEDGKWKYEKLLEGWSANGI